MNDKLKVRVDLPEHPVVKGESLWAESIGNALYKIKNIPIFSYGINYLDVVEASKSADGSTLEVRKVVERSGHHTVRIKFLGDNAEDQNFQKLLSIKGDGIGSEKWDSNLYALNVTPSRDYEEFIDLLEQFEKDGVLDFELAGEWEGKFDGTD